MFLEITKQSEWNVISSIGATATTATDLLDSFIPEGRNECKIVMQAIGLDVYLTLGEDASVSAPVVSSGACLFIPNGSMTPPLVIRRGRNNWIRCIATATVSGTRLVYFEAT